MEDNGKCYRIVTDNYCGYEVQEKKTKRFLFWTWTWWEQCDFSNTHSSIESAKEFIKNGAKRIKVTKTEPVQVWISENCK